MNPRVDVTIIDHYGSYSDLIDEYGNPIEVYINEERTYTEGQVGRLEQENEKLRELVRELYEDAFLEHPSHFEKTYRSRLAELDVEVDRECTMESETEMSEGARRILARMMAGVDGGKESG